MALWRRFCTVRRAVRASIARRSLDPQTSHSCVTPWLATGSLKMQLYVQCNAFVFLFVLRIIRVIIILLFIAL